MLGEQIKAALESVGVSEERVSRWLGRPCGCAERVERLDLLDRWARQLVKLGSDKTASWIAGLLEDQP